ncbi:MAG: hypothetical protein A3A51_02785 [Candidatus Levybacteria bacterium RIFCSPLOWO2_01_FULL_39_10]|nr:MAG: hypothetical protein A3A51_02785 [Candidatus Levybacteria bacterium RIFCSPLOWO2_01_FULL_39_10]
MAVERLTEQTVDVKREAFGPGFAGEWAYQTILGGATCETYIDGGKNKCGKKALGTVDVDIAGNLDLFPYCTEDHAVKLTSQLVGEIENNGNHTMPFRNGFERA